MTLQTALDDHRRYRDDAKRFPGERRTTRGLFAGDAGRLVHVAPDGTLRDFSYPLSGLAGVDVARFGLRLDGERVSLSAGERAGQRYHGDTSLVETTHDLGDVTATQYDLTLDGDHVTHVSLTGAVPEEASLWTVQRFAPDAQQGRVGRLDHGDAVEVFHRDEHDLLHATTPVNLAGSPGRLSLSALLEEPPDAERVAGDGTTRREDTALGGTVAFETPLARDGDRAWTTLVTALVGDGGRSPALSRVRALGQRFDAPTALEEGAAERASAPSGACPAVVADLRALRLLSAPSGARIAAPDFDPFFTSSGGYGYTWFRDDAEVSRHLLAAERALGLSLGECHERSAAFYCDTQREDGTWPHRVWADSGALAPGWANGRLEAGDGTDYQADQTASVLTFLATYLRERDPTDAERIERTLARGLDGLDASLDGEGLPGPCQNAWENATGRFAHTAGTFMQAYAAVARAPVDGEMRDRAARRADAVAAGIQRLWSDDRSAYGMRLTEGGLDDRLDSSSLALVDAHAEHAALEGHLPRQRRERLCAHVRSVLDGLHRETDAVEGLVRFEGDTWRRREQTVPKIWTVSTAWGAAAAARLATLLADHGRDPSPFDERAAELLALLLPDGPLSGPGGLLPEQVFDDGTPDSGTPLGWPHALRLATLARVRRLDPQAGARAGRSS